MSNQQASEAQVAAPVDESKDDAAAAAPVESKEVNDGPAADSKDYFVYEPTGDAGLDAALEFVGRLGFAADNPAIQAATTGDFGPLEAALKAMGVKAKGYDKFMTLGRQFFDRRKEAAKAAEAALDAAVHAAVGGKEHWEKVRAFSEEHADEAEAASIRAAFKAGGFQAVAMAEKLAAIYQRAQGPRKAVKDSAPAGAGATAETPLSPKEYAAAVAALRASTRRGPVEATPEYAALAARRRAFKQ